ncbi:AGR031Wp [Eremothecium gossypii ATCC 10895]|uniref:AGR031Wp n=1 Tax=Eremothecium gossypii (strain ATCC 10895 / CBS 109.51 / FGSC 9923 / NRRL Y-1056) TaxID=284811 RepID=Q750L1_EREGS|nr:AGR031Wp [Eremothecium gossypii ATCC 10895]AAS54520.1 AGR031Wp [Eremothecium gossypii ATCC 10895]AEY98852.1 FAGR031Wp [Eremothecium gossypii FDAG1]
MDNARQAGAHQSIVLAAVAPPGAAGGRRVLLPPLASSHQSMRRLETYLKQALDRGAFGCAAAPARKRAPAPVPVEKRRKHLCQTCGKGFTTSGHLARHNRIHTGEKNHACHFPGCGQRFSRHDNCLQHYRTHLKRTAVPS